MPGDPILISEITASAKVKPHFTVLMGTAGKLIEDADATHVMVSCIGASTHQGGPVEGELYKLRFNVAGEFESVQRMVFVGLAEQYGRYVFSKKV